MLGGVHPIELALLLAAAVLFAQAQDASHSLANERTSIERTYELTKYLEHQLKEIKDTYLSYLGPPFSDKDFSPPRPNSTALSLPSAATRLELWRGLENRARLAQNQRAYAVLLGAVRELARSTLCPYLQTSLLHFSTGLDGLLGSISGLMSSLGYALPPSADAPGGGGGGDGPQYPWRNAGGDGGRASSRPAPLMTQSLYKARVRSGPGGRDNPRRDAEARVLWGEQEEDGTRKSERRKERGREGRRGGEAPAAGGRSAGSRQEERGRRGKRESEIWEAAMHAEKDDMEKKEGGGEQWRGRRRLLSVSEDGGEMEGQGAAGTEPGVSISFPGTPSGDPHGHPGPFNSNNNNNNNLYSYKLNHPQHRDTARRDDEKDEGHTTRDSLLSSSSSSQGPRPRAPRSLFPPTLHPPLPPLSFFYPFGGEEEHPLLTRPVPLSLRRPAAVLSPPPLPPLYSSPSSSSSASAPLLSVRPALNDFSRKVEGFWVLRELQSWLWRSAKDFNRLKKRLRA